MSDTKEKFSTRYFQLTPNILVEYNYNILSDLDNLAGDASSYVIDLKSDASVVSNGYCATRSFLYEDDKERFVQPINSSESKFIKWEDNLIGVYKEKWRCDAIFSNSDPSNIVLRDKFRLHFTSRNYFGDYDGLIVTINIYDKIKNKIGIFSQYIKKTDDPELNHTPLLINQKLYTTYKNYSIPNIGAIIKKINADEATINAALSPNYSIMENTPVVMAIYGVKSTYTNNNYEYYNTEKINTIFIPVEDNTHILEVKCEEATDGDYFKIYPKVDEGNLSFSDYIYNISDGRPEDYIVFYELTMREYIPNNTEGILTHREQYIINAAKHSDTDNEKYKTNEGELDSIMYYRPIVINSGKIVEFIIDVNLNIINTLDNTTIVKRTSLEYTPRNGKNPKKYGKHMSKIYLGDVPSQINVYNKKPDIEQDGVKIINSGSNVKIENHQHSVIGFVESANVGVSIEQVPKENL